MFRSARISVLAVLVPLATAVVSHPAFCQESLTSSSLTGRVVDSTGALIPSAQVSAVASSTQLTFNATADVRGRFRIPYLAPGSYTITAHAPGFNATSASAQLTVGASFDVTLQMTVGTASTTLSVIAESPILEQNRSQISETVSQAEVDQLPYSGRNYLDLALLTPGVSTTNTASVQTFAETSPVIGQGYSINSQRNFSNSFVVDGLSANDDAAGLAGNSYSMDVVHEFQVVTSGGQAEFGRAMGGYFNIVTRSGSNDLHGTLYGFLRNQRLNASNALSQGKLPLTQGQYGASLSGPVKRDRSFFFGNYEGRRLNTDGVVTINPTQAAAVNARLNAIGFTGPHLTVSAAPTTLYPTTVHTDNAFVRFDHRFSDADQFIARYSYYRLNATNARGAGALADVSYGTAVMDTNHTIAINNVAMLSPRTFNETRGQFTWDSLNAPPNTQNSPAVVISGVATFGHFSSSPTARKNLLYEVVDNLVLQRGEHTFKTGADFLFNDDTITFPMSIAGSYTFASLGAFQSGVTTYSSYAQNFGTPFVQQNNPNIGFYVQDEWKATPSLTVNLGIRYDLQFLKTIRTDTNNISPRFGFAWSPFRSRTTVIRGSYGLFYDRVPLRALANALLSANNTTDASQGRLLQYSYVPSDTGAPAFPDVSNTPNPGSKISYALMNQNISNAYSEQVGVGLEQQLFRTGSLGISYQHARGLHLLSSYNTNINLDGSRPDSTRGNIKPYDGRFDSTYDGLAVSFVERPVTWGSVRISYTWSKAMDNVGEFFFSSPSNNFDFNVDRGRSDDDQRHRVVFDATLNSPMSPAHGTWDRVTHGWKLGGILQYYSRLPFNIVTGGQTKQQTTQRPCSAGYGLRMNDGTNPCTEALRGAMIGRNTGIGFDFFNLNTRLSRTFALTDRWRLETIAEAFNVLNHRNDMIPNATWGTETYPTLPNTGFGKATAVGDPRSVQLAMRISF
ncbi:TonB-dependent receptor domain-containing protein [Terriglobus sp. TAA 43]|uniref:TonB-dependent receptor n=1 Tax=Terriglobus sp. TAA 43 TaxID=278961 RepID=UPI000647116C|nr:TonB-dependent receptor [Terriglobus sp. TAA 43]